MSTPSYSHPHPHPHLGPLPNLRYRRGHSLPLSASQIIALCERLSGESANITYVPSIVLTTVRKFFRFFEFTWNISDRLHFSEILGEMKSSPNETNELTSKYELLSLEQYLQEYFGKILRKLKEANYQQTQQNKDISFL